MMSLNVVWQMISGQRYNYNDNKMGNLLKFIDYFSQLGKDILAGPVAAFPFLE